MPNPLEKGATTAELTSYQVIILSHFFERASNRQFLLKGATEDSTFLTALRGYIIKRW